ncbi:MAG: secondary thiamine-phosphate synthase enzyme YjbQ [Candidatus Omnitrophica bacterium]|nr:secondary thiamine-phosphate synthase enzyme YjbQ [Candidatus Omnitrophota bacterium]MCM8825902.1 secondary thiamine-phosphate synthase enzyme YjbQ [Candidatus Omnitrophota bacterium]
MVIINISSTKRTEFIDITSQIERVIREKEIEEGICIIFCPHTTAGLTINENADPSVRSDIIAHIEKLIPYRGHYLHLEGNADSHIKASIFGSSLSLIVKNKRLILGRWQGIYFCEFDGPRERKVYVKVLSG